MKKTKNKKTAPKKKKAPAKAGVKKKKAAIKLRTLKLPRKAKKPQIAPPGETKEHRITIINKARVKKITVKRSRKRGMNKIWVEVLLKDPRVRKWLVQAIGEHSIHIIQEFDRELSDEEISKKSELRASEVRVVLNRLHAHSLASYSRSRDKNSGWYSYIWRLDEKHATELAQGMEKEGVEPQVLVDDGQERYYCVVDGEKVIYTFEEAVEQKFKCPQTGKPLKYLE